VILLLKLWNLGTWRVGWTAKYDDIVRCSASCPAGPWPTSASDQRNAKLEMGFSCELTSDASREISCFFSVRELARRNFGGLARVLRFSIDFGRIFMHLQAFVTGMDSLGG